MLQKTKNKKVLDLKKNCWIGTGGIANNAFFPESEKELHNCLKIKNNKNFFSYEQILYKLKKIGFSRIFCESGFYTTNFLIKKRLIHNLYVFISSKKLGRSGQNSYKKLLSKLKFKKKKKLNINLFGDELYRFKIK